MESDSLRKVLAEAETAPPVVARSDLSEAVFRPASNHSESFVWFTRPPPTCPTVSIVSSRLGRQPEQFPSWFDALRTFAATVDPKTTCLLSAPRTTTDRYIQRISHLFQIPLLVIKPFPKRISENWVQEQLSAALLPQNELLHVAWYHEQEVEKPAVDQWLMHLAHEVRALKVGPRGNIDQAFQQRLKDDPSRTWLLVDERLTSTKQTESLLAAGASGWWLYDEAASSVEPEQTSNHRAEILSLADVPVDNFLLHWTRRRQGPWPDQCSNAWLDDLIFNQPGRDHQPSAALSRILALDRILGSNELTRHTTPVVCLANLPLYQLAARRTFRSHLNRWDFEPYGIAIDRDVVKELGGRPVIYGDQADWENLTPLDRPFFQVADSRDGKLDWRTEQEWRVCGNLDLSRVDTQSAVVFVSTHEEAEVIAEISRWPVVVLGE